MLTEIEVKYQEVKEILQDISYKEGWKWMAKIYSNEFINISFAMPVKDVATGKAIFIYVDMVTTASIPKDLMIREIFHKIVSLEKHEAAEWFKYKGLDIFNEHAKEEEERRLWSESKKAIDKFVDE